MCLNDEQKGLIGESNVVCGDANAGNTAQPASGFREPPAVCYRLRGSGVHLLGNAG